MSGDPHPCYNPAAAAHAKRVHLPVAASCNMQCAFCNRRYDCANESRPGVSSAVLSPRQAISYLERLEAVVGAADVIGIAGPGDAFADPDATLATLELARKRYPSAILCAASNGLAVAEYACDLARIGLSHLSLTVNAVDPAIGAQTLSWVRFERRVYRGEEAAALLIERQKTAIAELKKNGIIVKINTVVIPGINGGHVGDIAETFASCGADVHNCMPFLPVAGSALAGHPRPDHDTMQKARWAASRYMTVVKHCARCRADAAGVLGADNADAVAALLRDCAAGPLDPADDRPHIAVASREGMLVNEHLGRAERFYIFGRTSGAVVHVDTREAPPAGGGIQRWRDMAALLSDCRAVLACQAGEAPKDALRGEGIRVIVADGFAEEAVAAVFEGKSLAPAPPVRLCDGPAAGRGCA